jgi:hypothetical protein
MAQSLIALLQHFELFLTLHTPKLTYPPLDKLLNISQQRLQELQDSTEADLKDEDVGDSADPLPVTEDSHYSSKEEYNKSLT